MTRIYFTSDIHGSEVCWKKFLNAGNFYKADVAIMGGDITGKVVVPIVEADGGTYEAHIFGRDEVMKSRQEVDEFKAKVMSSGYYPYMCGTKEYEHLQNDSADLSRLFDKLIGEGINRWMEIAERKLDGSVKVFVSPGNDDRFIVDPILESSNKIIDPEEKLVEIDKNHLMITSGWVNPTPWNTAREEPEDRLMKRFERLFKLTEDYGHLIANLHPPPYKSSLDAAPKLDEKFTPVVQGGQQVMIPVGSKAVYDLIKQYQPKLGLHGHVHESPGIAKIGKTLCVNPGSEYGEGILRGFIVDLEKDKISKYWRTEG
ncbi:MAG: metallophosphoesterase [Promethearchaeati archaeon SRVP18_Atabeyarchaeia-1]